MTFYPFVRAQAPNVPFVFTTGEQAPDGGPQWSYAWRQAVATSKTTPVTVAFIGTSVTAGAAASSYITNSFPALIRSGLLARGNPLYGDFWHAWEWNPTYGNPAGSTPYAAVTGGSSAAYEGGFGSRVLNLQTASSTTFTLPYACTSIDIVYCNFSAGTFNVNINSTGNQTVTVTSNSGSIAKQNFAGPFASGSTVVIGTGSAVNVCMLSGVNTYASATAGLGFAWCGIGGSKLVDLGTTFAHGASGINQASFPIDKIALWSGNTATGVPYNTSLGFPAGASLAIIEYGLNDFGFSSVRLFGITVRRLMAALLRANANCSIAYLWPSFTDMATIDDYTGGAVVSALASEYKRAAFDTVLAFGGATIDIDTQVGQFPVTSGYRAAGVIHPNTAGHQTIANLVLSVI